MKRILFLLAILSSLTAKPQDDVFFPLPIIPETIDNLQDRSDFLVEHYWDFCDLKKAFSSRDKMAYAFSTYLGVMPYASAEAVFASVDKFMSSIAKRPENQLFIIDLAEGKLYSDTADMASDELYMRFLEPVVANKKIGNAEKLRYQHQLNVLRNSQTGHKAKSFGYTDIHGGSGVFEPDTTIQGTILFFNDPDCSHCSMARLRLSADVITNRLIDAGIIDFYSVYPGEPTDDWKSQAQGNPEKWKSVAAEDVDEIYDLRTSPAFYVLNASGNILLKTDNEDVIIDIMAKLSPLVRKSVRKQTETTTEQQ